MNQSRSTKLTIAVVISLFFLSACLDEYNPPEIVNSEPLLVVEGNISDVETSIRLSSTSTLGNNALVPVENAVVRLESENQGILENLTYTNNGQYSIENDLAFNDRYRIVIEAESDTYVSEYLDLLPTPKIDSVGWEQVDGVFQVHVSTHDDTQSTRYYLWEFEETWLYRSRYNSYFTYEEGEFFPRARDNQIYFCWKSEPSSAVLVGTTVNLTEDVIFKQPVQQIVPQDNLKLSNRYSILVKQYALTKEAYEFWELLKKNSESVGTFFDPQPSQLPTNINCTTDPNKQVIGYISASQVKEERLFVSRIDLPFDNIPFFPTSLCELDTVLFAEGQDEVELQFGGGFNLPTLEIVSLFSGIVIGFESAPRQCADCRIFGGTNQEPEFWRN